MLREGDRVRIPELGAGTVKRVAMTGIVVAVDALGGMKVQYSAEALSPETADTDVVSDGVDVLGRLMGGSGRPTTPPALEPGSAPGAACRVPTSPEYDSPSEDDEPRVLAESSAPTRGQRERRSLEALRFGLVPDEGLEKLTLGWDDLRRWIIATLPHSRGEGDAAGVAEIVGPFGTGKSHTMKVIREVARTEGYLTASVEVDGTTVSLSDPARLLHALWSTLRGTKLESSTPLLDLHLLAIDSRRSVPKIAPRGIDRIRDNYATIKAVLQSGLLDEFADDLEAVLSSRPETKASEVARRLVERGLDPSKVRLRPMIGRAVEDRPYDFVEAILGYTTIAQAAGFEGLVVTVDEFEVEHRYAHHWRRVDELLRVLGRYMAGELDQPDVPLTIYFAAVGEAGHEGDARIDELVQAANGFTHQLKSWDGRQRSALARRLHALYASAYAVEAEFVAADAARVVERLEEVHGEGVEIRAFIKHYVAHLDRIYGPGQHA